MRSHIQTQSEWEQEMAGKVLNLIRSELYLDLPFLNIALGRLQPYPKEELQTFATDGNAAFFSPEQLLRLFPKNPAFLDRAYLHMVMHCIFSHLWLGGKRDRRLWGIACDIAVEYVIDGLQTPCTRRILSWQRQKTYGQLKELKTGISAATIYLWLLDMEEAQLSRLQIEFHTDDHRYWPRQEEGRAESPRPSLQEEWSKISRQTAMEQKSRGREPDEGEQLLMAQLSAQKSRRSYREFLRQFTVLREELHADPDEYDLNYYTYGLRFYGNMPLIEPVESREVHKIREFVIVLDTSYSTNGELVKNFIRETYTLLSQTDSFFRHSHIRLLQCDDRVRTDQTIRSQEDMEKLLHNFTLIGGGGTDFRPAFAYVQSLRECGEMRDLSGLLYFTDGKGIYPGRRPDYKCAFLFLDDYDEDAVPVWAIRLKLDPAEFLENKR